MKHKVNIGDLEDVTACGIEFDLPANIDHSIVWAGVTCEACLDTRTGFGGEDWSPLGVAKDQRRERIAKFIHEDLWAHWMKYLWKCCEEVRAESNGSRVGEMVIPPDKANRWWRQMNTDYEELPDVEKVSDVQLADKLMRLTDTQ